MNLKEKLVERINNLEYEIHVQKMIADMAWEKLVENELKVLLGDVPFQSTPFQSIKIQPFFIMELDYSYDGAVISNIFLKSPQIKYTNDDARLILKLVPFFEWYVKAKFIFLESVNDLYDTHIRNSGLITNENKLNELKSKLTKINNYGNKI